MTIGKERRAILKALLVPVGAGLWWASITLSPLSTAASAYQAIGFCAFGLVVTALLFCASPMLAKSSFVPLARAVLILSVLGGSVSVLSCCVAAVPTLLLSAASFLFRLGGVLLMLLWSVHFVGVDRSEAFEEVSKTGLFALCLHAGCLALLGGVCDSASMPDALLVTEVAMRVLSAGIFLWLQTRAPEPVVVRKPTRSSLKKARGFVASRLFMGLLIGIFQMVPYAMEGLEKETLSAFSAAGAAIFAFGMAGWLLYQHRTGEDTHVAVFIPLIALALPVLPVSYETNALAVGFVYSSVWLSWITLSSIQLSELKYEFQLSDLTLAFGEKCLVMVAILVGSIVGTTVLNGLDPSSFGLAVPYAVAVVPACFSAFMLLKLTSARTHEAVVKTLITNENDQLECIYRTIADTYGLSRREQEILGHLARGHTGTYISSKLDISPGTVRSHTGNIYKKTSCHTKEELMQLVECFKHFNE